MKISQREARRMKQRIAKLEGILEGQKRGWSSEWPSSVVIARIIPSEVTMAAISLKHAVVAVPQGNELAFFADEL